MLIFNDRQLRYLLEKLKIQFDNKVDREQYGIIVQDASNGGLKIVDGVPTDDTEISLTDAQLLNPNAQVENFIEIKDKGLSEVELTVEEKELLQDLLNESLDEKLDKRLDGFTFDVITQAEFDALDDGTLEENKIYIVTDSNNKVIFIGDYTDEKDLELFDNNKINKEKGLVQVETDETGVFPAGSLEVIADDIEPTDEQIKLADALLLYEKAEVGMYLLEQDKVLSEVMYKKSDDELINELIDINIDKVLVVDDIADSLSPEESYKVLSAKQGTKIEKDYLESKKHKYLTLEEYGDLFEIAIDTNGAITIVGEDDECDDAIQIRIDDILIRAKNRGLESDGVALLKVGDVINIIDNSNQNTVYHITDNDGIYGLTEEQLNHLKVAYEHSLVDTSMLYGSKDEIHKAKTDSDNKSFSSLAKRLLAIDDLVDLLPAGTNMEACILSMNFEESSSEPRSINGYDFNTIQPWSGIRKCNIKDGQVVCYENEEDYVEDGTNGDVMVEIPKFYYRVSPVELKNTDMGEQIIEARWMVSQTLTPNFKVHPAFIRNDIEVNRIYVGAFENSLNNNNELMSIIDAAPLVSTTLSEVQNLCVAKGNGYEVMDILTLSALQILFIVEHNSFDSQSSAGLGLVNVNDISNTGSDDAVNYRGIENLWGNVWNIVNGLNLELSFNVADTGFIDGFGYDKNNDSLFIPISANGSSVIPPCDMCEQNGVANKLISIAVGNTFNSNVNAGLFSYKFDDDINIKANNIGSRLQFYK